MINFWVLICFHSCAISCDRWCIAIDPSGRWTLGGDELVWNTCLSFS